MISPLGDPVLRCDAAREFETRFFGGEVSREWAAMQRAGRGVADAVLRDCEEIGGFPARGKILVLAGKGHNGGDALIAAQAILEQFPHASADVVFAFGERALRPLAARAWQQLAQAAGPRVSTQTQPDASGYAVSLDGVFGFQFRPPVPPQVAALFAAVEALPIGLRAAIDLPSGLTDETKHDEAVLRADFTYSTGCVKAPCVNGVYARWLGRLRNVDVGFFAREKIHSRLRVLTPAVLAPLARLRSPESDKRTYGHLFVIGGSRSFPGAVLMAVQAALRSGAGLVTAFVPESLAAAYAAGTPEAMWVGWPETPEGGLALEGQHLLRERLERADALLIGPGLSREGETLALVGDIVKTSALPLVLDADALQPDIVRTGTAPRVLTPHIGEFRRVLKGDDFHDRSPSRDSVVVLKGRLTAITFAGEGYYSPFGGPVLARGGSGDLLAGMVGAQLAQTPQDPLGAAARATVWHGLAADLLARSEGQVAVRTTQVLDFLPAALRESGAWPPT